jgi:hypothetical protein
METKDTIDIDVIEYKGSLYMQFDSLINWLQALCDNSKDASQKDTARQMIGMIIRCRNENKL